jgi:hypothetical protein
VNQRVSDAIVVWTGYGSTASPRRDERALVEAFGEEEALDLLQMIRRLEEEFYASDARHTAPGLKEMGDVSAAQFRSLHPELSEEAVQALAWCYTYDYK